MFFKPEHALSVTLNAQGVQWAWTRARPGQAPELQRVWHSDVLDAQSLQALQDTAAWPRGSAMRVALPPSQAVCQRVTVAAGLSWRDRRFQQALALLEASPALGDDAVCDEDARGQVCGVPYSVVRQWQQVALTLGCRLQWLGLTRTLQEQSLETWRWQQLQCVGPNWAAREGFWWWRDQRRRLRRLLPIWRRRAYKVRAVVLGGFAVGALGMSACMHGLAYLGQARDAMTHTETRLAQLRTQQQHWQHTQKEQQAVRATRARMQAAWQPLQTHGQATAQWLHVLMQAQGVAFLHLTLEPVGEHSVRWHLQAEARTPAHAQKLCEALTALPIWHSAPAEHDAHWQHGEPGRFSVWVFALQAELPPPW